MVRLKKGNKAIFFPFSQEEADALGLRVGAEYEFLRAKEGVYVLVRAGEENAASPARTAQPPAPRLERRAPEASEWEARDGKGGEGHPLEAHILELLLRARGTEAMEGRFERLLNKEELGLFGKMMEGGKIERFKTNEKYNKCLYRAARAPKSEFGVQDVPKEGQYFPKGYYFTKSEQEARDINDSFSSEIRAGKIVGLKDFDGTYYILENGFFDRASQKILGCLREQGKMRMEDIVRATGLAEEPVRGVCVILKERGDVTEKKKGEYAFIP